MQLILVHYTFNTKLKMWIHFIDTIIFKRYLLCIFFLSIPFFLMSEENLTYGSDSIYIQNQDKTIYYDSDSLFYNYAHKGFNNVIGDLYEYYEDVFWNLPESRRQMELQKMKDIAEVYDSDSLRNEADFLEIISLPQAEQSQAEYKVQKIQEFIDKASLRNDVSMKLRGMNAAFDLFWGIKEYAKAFSQIYLMEKELESITDKDFPDRGHIYFKIGQAYFFFRDYEKAIPYLRKAMTPSVHYCDRSDLQARNTLGLYYNLKGQVDSAEYYFRSAYNSYDKVKSRSKYDALSLSNLGHCLVKRKDYNEAISYFRAGLQRILKDDDLKMASDITVGLANCYLEKGDMRKSKHMIDSSVLYINKSDNKVLYRTLYPLMSKYYIKTGNKFLADAYIDSTVVSMLSYMEEYSSLNILRAEQALFEVENKAKDEELYHQTKSYNDKIFYGIIIIGFISIGLIIFFILYRKNRMAYQALVLKNQDWAEAKTSYKPIDNDDNDMDALSEEGGITDEPDRPDEEDITLMNQVNDLIKKEKIFKDLDLTLDSLSKQMNINRNYLSKAINKTTGKNFNTYINEYRIKEAIKIMSDEKSDLISIDAIALEVGFSNRISFYQSFKKITGLTPSHFRNNKVRVM